MFFLYNCFAIIISKLLALIALFNPKMKLFVEGRKDVFTILSQKISPTDKTIWFHAASLGEYEQGLPVIEKVKATYPTHKIIVTFFSPSGYEVRKNNTVADVTVYLPLDTKKNAQKFIALTQPDLVFFIKYEFWPNYLKELKSNNIKTFLISGILRENQAFFKWYGGFYRKALDTFTYFFVQNEQSKKLLASICKNNVAISGDTRFDRVAAIVEKDNRLEFVSNFKNDQLTVVIGSSWPKDELLLTQYINTNKHAAKFIIAPHNIKPEQINELKTGITRKTILFSEHEGKDLSDYDVLIIDTIGILTKIYSYADIAYVGGGFGNPGIHNILEPATFGVPILIGPNYSHFAEATALINLDGATAISNLAELTIKMDELLRDELLRFEKGHICSTFIGMNKGATQIIMNYVRQSATI